MTANYHTDIPQTATDDVSFINAPLGQLDLALTNILAGNVGSPFSRLLLNTTGAKTLSSDTLDVANLSFVTVTSETGTADDCKTLVNPVAGALYVLQAASGHTITIKHGTGNIYLNGAADVVISGNKQLFLFYSPLAIATDVFVPSTAFGVIYPRTQLGASAASMSIPTIPATFKHLRLIIEARGDAATPNESLKLQLNSDAITTDYYTQHQYTNGTTNTGLERLGSDAGALLALTGAAATAPANVFGKVVLDFINYASATAQKDFTYLGGVRGGTGTGTIYRTSGFGSWLGVAAITSMLLLPNASANFVAGSALTLYGFN